VFDTVDCGDRRGIAGLTTTSTMMTTHELKYGIGIGVDIGVGIHVGVASVSASTLVLASVSASASATALALVSASALTAGAALAPLAVAMTAIGHCPLPKRQRIRGLSRESHHESLDGSAEGADHQGHCNNEGRTRQWQRRCQSAGCEGNGLPTMTNATGSRESGLGRIRRQPTRAGRRWRQAIREVGR